MLHTHVASIGLGDLRTRAPGVQEEWSQPDVAQERAMWLLWATDLVSLYALVLLVGLLILVWCLVTQPTFWRQRVIWPAYGGAVLAALPVWIGGTTLSGRSQVWPVQSSFVLLAVLLALPLGPRWWSALRVQRWVLRLGLLLHALPLLWVMLNDLLASGLSQSETLVSRSLLYVTLATWLLGLYVALMLGMNQLANARWVPQWLDHFCMTGWYTDRATVRAASVALSQTHTLNDVVARLHDLAQRLNFQAGVLFWPDGDALVPLWSFGLRDVHQWRLPSGGMLAQYLTAVSAPQQRSHLLHVSARSSTTLQPSEQRLIEDEQLRLWLPLVSHGVLRGVLVVGAHQRMAALCEDDGAILLPLLSQAAAATEHLMLSAAFQRHQAEAERLRHELAASQRRLLHHGEQDRLRLAQDLHDGVLQQLIGVQYLVSGDVFGNSQRVADDSGGAVSAAAAQTLYELQSAVGQVRGLIRALRPAGLDEFGLATALEGFVAQIQRERGAQPPLITLALDQRCRTLPRLAAQCLFRVTQEALRNSLKHAQAAQITISMRVCDDEAILRIHDDGAGFSVPLSLAELVCDDHFGLAGMRERVAWVGGTLDIQSQPGLGTTIVVNMSLSELEHEDATLDSRCAGGRSSLDP